MDFNELSNFFDEFIEVDANPYNISYQEIYKENGVIKKRSINEEFYLDKFNHITDLFKSNIESIDHYPKTFLKRIFNIKNNDGMEFYSDDKNYIILMSEKTSKIFKTNLKVNFIDEDDKVIILKRGRLIYYKSENDIYGYIDKENYRVLSIK